jgi:hypothetical protein
LVLLVGALVIVPLIVTIILGESVLPLLIGWALIVVLGAGSAGLRARGSAYQTLHQDWERDQRTEAPFERPEDEGRLL